MHQLVSTSGVQVTTIPIMIPATSVAGAPSINAQSLLWFGGCQPDDEERIVEMKLDQEADNSQKEDDSQEEVLNRDEEFLRGVSDRREYTRETRKQRSN